MTNEEIAMRIQSGEIGLLSRLWAQIERYAAYRARQVYRNYYTRCSSHGVTLDDLMQIASMVMCECIEKFDSGAGIGFLTYYSAPLRWALFGALRFRGKQNPLDYAASLDESIDSEDGDSSARLELMEDEAAQEAFERVPEDDCRRILWETEQQALAALPARHADILRWRYYEALTQREIAERLGVSQARIQQLEKDAIHRIRTSKYAKKLWAFLYEDAMEVVARRISIEEFKHLGSSTERAAERISDVYWI